MSTPYVFSKVSITPMYDDCVAIQGFAPDGSSNTFYLQGESLQEMADKLWICGVKPSAVKAVAEAKPMSSACCSSAASDLLETNLAAIYSNAKVLLHALGMSAK